MLDVEVALSPTPYVPPPLDLLPTVLQQYVRAAAESLRVDVSYVFLPLLSSSGAAIGHTSSIILKRGFIQPPVIWTGVVGPTGSLKSPGQDEGCFATMEHERELTRIFIAFHRNSSPLVLRQIYQGELTLQISPASRS